MSRLSRAKIGNYAGVYEPSNSLPENPNGIFMDKFGNLWSGFTNEWLSIPDSICKTDLLQFLNGSSEPGIWNKGTDKGNAGRPSFLFSKMRPMVDDFSYRIIFSTSNDTNQQYVFGIGKNSSTSQRMHAFRINVALGDNRLCVYIGGQLHYGPSNSIKAADGIVDIIVSASSSGTLNVWLNGVLNFTVSFTGTYIENENSLMFGNMDSTDLSSYGNHFGFMCCALFKEGFITNHLDFDSLNTLDQFAFNQGTGISTPSINSNPCIWSNSIPSEIWRYRWLEDFSGNYTRAVYNNIPDVIVADGTEDRLVGFFEKDSKLTVPKSQEITADWKCFLNVTLIPEDPTNYERIYGVSTTDTFRVYIDLHSSYPASINANGNGTGMTPLALNCLYKGVVQVVEIWLKIGAIKIIVDGVDYGEVPYTFAETSWSSYDIGTSSLGLSFTGEVLGFNDCDEEWSLPNLTGSLGTVGTIVNAPNFTTKGIQNKSNLNYSNNSDLTTLGVLNSFLSLHDINLLHNYYTIFTSSEELKVLIYSSSQTGSNQDYANDYVGKLVYVYSDGDFIAIDENYININSEEVIRLDASGNILLDPYEGKILT